MIGILDSGLAGLLPARRLMAELPQHRFLYFGDTACGPYGQKSPEAILRHALGGLRFLEDRGARKIVLACLATAGAAGRELAARSSVPVLDGIEGAAEAAVGGSPRKRIGVIGSPATIRSGAFERRIQALAPDAVVHSAACPLISALVAAGWMKRPETTMIVKKHLMPLKVRNIDTLILGHALYPMLEDVIQRKIGRRVRLVNPWDGLAERLAGDEPGRPPSEPRIAVYLSDVAADTDGRAAGYLKRRVRCEAVTL